jgi:alkanesulfonate monooxygenase SsuD/methylene tetrahydromethanopterin reductase-like flavin-dependent oxidoreductase (luciferase family)
VNDRPKFAIGVPNVGPYSDPALLCALARCAEDARWDGFFLWDHLLYPQGWPVIDPWVVLSAIASQTKRLSLGLLVAALPRQLPWEVAKRAVSIDHLGSRREEYAAFGQAADERHRGDRLDEALQVITGLWSGESFSFQGEHFTVSAPPMHPQPVRQPRIPIWVGGRWPNRRPFRRAARWDGVFPTHVSHGQGETMTPAELRQIVEFVREQRPGSTAFDVALEGKTPEGGDDAADTVQEYVSAGLTWWIEALGWWRGDTTAARARVAAGPPSDPAPRAD